MSESVFASIVEEWAEREWEALAGAPVFKTSKKHDRAMKRIFKLYEKNTRRFYYQNDVKVESICKRIMIAVLAIILAALAGCSTAHFITQSFSREVRGRIVKMVLINKENSPTEIEKKYYLSKLPKGFEFASSGADSISESILYRNKQTGEEIWLRQFIKKDFISIEFDPKKEEMIEVDINGHSGMFFDMSYWELRNEVVWDNGDYLMIIYGNLPKDELARLAKSAKVQKK